MRIAERRTSPTAEAAKKDSSKPKAKKQEIAYLE